MPRFGKLHRAAIVRVAGIGAIVLAGAATSACADLFPRAKRPIAATAIAFPIGQVPLQDYGTQAPGRKSCSKVMLLPGEQAAIGEDLVATVEGHLIERGMEVTSSAWTGTVVADPSRQQVEGAAKLSLLERALVLAKRSNVDCVFQVFKLDTRGTQNRFFVLHPGQAVLVEESGLQAESQPAWRKRVVSGPRWEVDGKVIAVDSGAVLAIVHFAASTADPQRNYAQEEIDGALQPSSNATISFNRPEDLDPLRNLFMNKLVQEIRGPYIPRSVPGPGELKSPSE